ncbi:MAG: diacylglycerol kinase family lipid kinase [Chloroflexi bacterium]|nr:MAG: diacylglycerol kinase family lipid kinase [Chloroflexota bacterium]
MTPKPKIIYNLAAGKGNAGKVLPKVEVLLRERGFEYELTPTESPGHAQFLSQEAAEEGRELVVAAGGDGTVNETINGLMRARQNGHGRPALGVIPVGSGNDFAFGMGIPNETGRACDTLVDGKRRTIDVGHVTGGDYPQGRYFGNGIGLGFDTVVGFEAAKITWLRGAASYFAALIKTIFLYSRAPVYELVLDGKTQRRAFLLVSVMNGQRMGGAFLMAPESHPGDGSFDLCLAGQVSQARILPLALTFISGKQGGDPAVKMTRAQKISIRAVDGTIPAHADGETLCTAGEYLSVELLPAALQVISTVDGSKVRAR